MNQLFCRSCGRELSNDIEADNAARWTVFGPRWPYCADDDGCRRDVEGEWEEIRGFAR